MAIIILETMFTFIIQLFAFLLISLMVLYFPGRLILGKRAKELEISESFFLSLLLGILVIILETVTTGILNIRIISLPLLLIIVFYSASIHGINLLTSLKDIFSNKILIVLLILGILVQGSMNFPSGWHYANGINFWSSQGHDGLWHVSLMEEIKNNFPPSMPLYAGYPLQNYHYASDIFMGEFYRLFPFFTSLDLYFRFYPILFSFLYGLGAFVFAKRYWNMGSAYWSVFFTYFCGSFGYIVSIINHNFPLSGETTFWASQGNTILGNPPHALGIIFLTTILLLLTIWYKNRNNFWLLLTFLFGFGLCTVKVSSGAVLVIGMVTAGFYLLISEKQFIPIIFGLILAISNYSMLKIISPTAQSFLILEPLWFPRTMMVVRLNWMDWEMRRQHYYYVNTLKGTLHGYLLELEAILIFIIGNTGARVLGLIGIFRNLKKKIHPVDIFMISGSIFSIVVVLLFVQRGIIYNLIQFVQIYLHFLGLYAGATTYFLLSKVKYPRVKIAISVIIISISIPTAVGNIFDFYGLGRKPLAIISNTEIDGLNWLKDNTSQDSVIFTKPFDKDAHYGYKTQPLPISAWYSTMYVHSLSVRRTYLTGEEQLMITGYKIDDEVSAMKKFMLQQDPLKDKNYLSAREIDYLYFRKEELAVPIQSSMIGLSKVFENQEVIIYKNEK